MKTEEEEENHLTFMDREYFFDISTQSCRIVSVSNRPSDLFLSNQKISPLEVMISRFDLPSLCAAHSVLRQKEF